MYVYAYGVHEHDSVEYYFDIVCIVCDNYNRVSLGMTLTLINTLNVTECDLTLDHSFIPITTVATLKSMLLWHFL